MKIILDTHIFLWSVSYPEKISKHRSSILNSQSNVVYISSISFSEIFIKEAINKLRLNFDPIKIAQDSGFELLDFSADDSKLLKKLPLYHKDPFDRMLISQAINRDFKLMTDDKKIKMYDCKLL
ncbi:MAG: Unknown protein [uncultured Campylobacterales bacterium]|uniref:PIN domain-containing protein n=1 Tax=uncultured Campylobacterales bacterium TaxID=352960 RepID=A0A6S6SGD7_9BACT|nr:MAG: Unknown protein [uncultured Campylobacterales bacterium]